MKKPRRRLVHFLMPDAQEPLCRGEGEEPSRAAVNGVAVCAICAQRMAERVRSASGVPLPRRRIR